MPDIIFIGAGPVGLLGAIDLKLQCPEKDILMFEKYKTPLRHHAMYIEHSSFAGMSRIRDFGKLLDDLPQKIVISDLEKRLRDYAISIDIKIEYKEVSDFNELKTLYPDTQYFVGSGGLRGIIHPQVFNGENQINEPLRYAIEVKYKASGATRALNRMTELPGVLACARHTVSEYVGYLKNNLTPVSLRIFIDEPTYTAMKAATFKNPWTLADKERIPADLFRTINVYLQGRNHLAGEIIEEGSLTISTITLSIYASKHFCKQNDEKIIFQIGEEGFACPFYRSFNDNAFCIPFFVKAMKALFDNHPIKEEKISCNSLFKCAVVEEDPVKYYQKSVQKFVNSEIKIVHFLNSGVDVVEASVGVSQLSSGFTSSKLAVKEEQAEDLQEIDNSDNFSSCACTIL